MPDSSPTADKTPRLLDLAQIGAYNPHRYSPEQLRAVFVARQPVLQNLVASIAAETPDAPPQHHLLVGLRGMGKTTLLLRLRVELDQPPLSARFIALSFPEEQYNIDRLSKLWLNCLDALADALEVAKQTEEVERLDDTIAQLIDTHSTDEAALARAALGELLATSARLGRRCVLLLDNLDLILDRLRSHDSELRAVLTRSGAPIIVGASTHPLAQQHDYGAAFFDAFRVHYLDRLGFDEMRSVLLTLASLTGETALRDRLSGLEGRLRALHQLTGGNPRTTVLLLQIFARGFSPDAWHDLEALLDVVTPLYKARFEELSDQAQIVVDALALHWAPATNEQLAAFSRLPSTAIASHLDRLRKSGLVEDVEVTGTKRRGYQLAERFFNIWYLMRRATRRQRRNLIYLTRFIESFYEPVERSEHARRLLAQALDDSHATFALALAEALSKDEPGLRADILSHAYASVLENCREQSKRLDEHVDPQEVPPHSVVFDELKAQLIKNGPTDGSMSPREYADLVLGAFWMPLDFKRLIASSPPTEESLSDLKKSAAEKLKICGEDASEWLSARFRKGLIVDSYDASQAFNTFLAAETPKQATAAASMLCPFELPAFPAENAKRFSDYCLSSEIDDFDAYIISSTIASYVALPQAVSAYENTLSRSKEPAIREFVFRSLGELFIARGSDADLQTWLKRCDHEYPQSQLITMSRVRALHRLGDRDKTKEVLDEIPLGILIFESDQLDFARLYYMNWPEPKRALLGLSRQPRGMFSHAIATLRLLILRDQLGEWREAREESKLDLATLPNGDIHLGVFACYEQNWGLACEAFRRAAPVLLEEKASPVDYEEPANLVPALAQHLGYGQAYLDFFKTDLEGDEKALPRFLAIEAHLKGGKEWIKNAPAETRPVAEAIFDRIAYWRNSLPDSTRRKP